MIKKRPLCMAALAVAVLLLLLPSGIWMHASPPEGVSPTGGITGEICRIEKRAEGQAVHLKHSNISDKGILLIYFDAEQPFSVGNTIRIEPPYRIWEPEAPSNPGQFDARLYYQTQHITHLGSAEHAVLTGDRVFWPGELLRRLRENLSTRCTRLFGEKQGGVLRAMLLGDKTELLEETKNIYQKSGMSHLLAISGLHISIAGAGLYKLLRKKGCSYGFSGGLGLTLVLLYGAMTGMSVSTARAAAMFALAVAADFLGRSYDMLTALAAAALLLLLEQPLYVRSASFLLSFGAVLGVGALYPAVRRLFPVSGKVWEAFLLSLSIQLATLPLVQWFYYEFPLYSIGLNLLVIPLMAALMFCGIGALGVSFLSWRAAWAPAFACRLILSLYEGLGKGTLRLPWSVIVCGRPKLWQIILYYGGLGGLILWQSQVREREKWRLCAKAAKGEEEGEPGRGAEEEGIKRRRKKERGLSLAAAFLLCVCLQFRFSGGFSFTMLDVGQGDSLFFRTQGGMACLIDGGSSDVKHAGRYRILPFLKEQGVGKLHFVMVTHTDKDHISGVEELLLQAAEPGGVRIGALLLSEQSYREEAGRELAALAKKAGAAVKVIKAGTVLENKGVKLFCLHPGREGQYADRNAGSLVFRLAYKEFSMLLTGDLEETGEKEILEQGTDIRCEVLKAGHHGSRFSTSEEWLRKVQPKLTLISCGRNNSYGHPHEETLERLEDAGSRKLLTMEEGAVTIRSDGVSFWAEGYKKSSRPAR